MRLFKYLAGTMVAFAAAFATLAAQAAPVVIEPGAYDGYYRVHGATMMVTGRQTVDIAPGQYALQVGGDVAAQVLFTVDPAGNVTSGNPTAIAASGNTLSFQTTDVTVDPTAEFTAQGGTWVPYYIMGVFQTGPQTFAFVPGLAFTVQLGGHGLGRVRVHVDAAGNLTSDNPAALSTSGATATFNMVDVTVDPTAEFTAQGGMWSPLRVTASHLTGKRTFKLAPNLGYQIQVGWHAGTRTDILVDAAGHITSTNPAAMTGSGDTLTLKMVDVTVDPTMDYTGDWYALGILTGPQFGERTFKVPPAMPHWLRVGAYAGGDVEFRMDEAGIASVNNPLAVTTMGGSMVFETTKITIETDSPATWAIHAAVTPNTIGNAEVTLVPNLRYFMRRGGTKESAVFAVASPCAIDPPVVTIAGDSYAISCGASDSDGDGAPDDVDNCPLTANADQLDRDLDGLGDACDADIDGDGFANAGDNCPASANPGQEDLDADGLGDVCDNDADGDAVDDDFDNCPLQANPDQADSEGDGQGDVCDIDDDGDLIEDAFDNCPLDPNPTQADYDGDGAGDICDGDVDGDRVADEADLCPLSPMDLLVNPDGCTGAQAIGLICKPEAFVQHGQYVSCVANAANAAVDEGLISPKEKAGFVKQAAKK